MFESTESSLSGIKIFFITMFLCAISQFLIAQEIPVIRLTTQWGTTSYDDASGIAIDSSGNIYVIGSSGDLDGNANYGDLDAFLTKFDNNGNKLWIKQWRSADRDSASGIAIDSFGNVYVTGFTLGIVNGSLNLDHREAFLIKFDNNGNKLWTKQWGTVDWDNASRIAIDSFGNIYVTGQTINNSDSYMPYRYPGDALLTKFDNNGNKLWTKQWGSTGWDSAFGVAIDSLGNIYVTGFTSGALDDNTYSGYFDVFLTKFDNNGNKLWTKQWGTTDWDSAFGIAIDSSGNIYVTGDTDGIFDSNINSCSDNAFLTKFDNNGNKLWTKQWRTTGNNNASGVIIDSLGNIYVTGFTSGALDDNTYSGYFDAFLTKFDNNGNKLWTKQWGTTGYDKASGIAIDSFENIYITGSTSGALDGNVNSGFRDVFLTKISINKTPSLIAEEVNPKEGNTSTEFTFKVKYSDADNDAPADGYPRLHIKKGGAEISGSPYQMLTKDTNLYSEGRIYTSTITLAAGNDYSYWFETYDVWSSSAVTAFAAGPQVSTFTATNSAPVLDAGKVSPEKGNTLTSFTFKVKYSDADNDAPKGGSPRLHIKERGSEIFGSPFEMKSEDAGSYIEGRMYTLNKILPEAKEYSYYFEAYDIYGTTAIGLPVNEKAGPEVLNKKNKAPILIFMNHPKSILRTPNTINKPGEYNFSIKYKDEDEDAPLSGYPRLHIKKGEIEIEGSPFVMAEADQNKYSEGREYNCKPVLKAGANYTYYFEAYDINNTTAEGFISNSSFAVVLNTLENAYCYPSPAHLSKGDVIKFSGFSPDTKINILSSSGHVLKEMSADIYGSIAPWDGKTEEGEILGTGVYIVHAVDSNGNKKMFNLFIVN